MTVEEIRNVIKDHDEKEMEMEARVSMIRSEFKESDPAKKMRKILEIATSRAADIMFDGMVIDRCKCSNQRMVDHYKYKDKDNPVTYDMLVRMMEVAIQDDIVKITLQWHQK